MDKMKIAFNKEVLQYNIKADSIVFWCTPVDNNVTASILLNQFLCEMSEGNKVFFEAYRLPNVFDVCEASVILEKAEALPDPFHLFFHLSEAKVKSDCFDCACEASLYYFDSKVKWPDFLAKPPIGSVKEFMQEELLSACFSSLDHGADFWFVCKRLYEEKVLQFFRDMERLGWELQPSPHLNFP